MTPVPTGQKSKRSGAWQFRLYVAGQTPRCLAAQDNLRRLCEAYLKGRYQIAVIDLLDRPELARDEDIFALPTLVRILPGPTRTLIGDLSDTERVLAYLGLTPEQAPD